MRKLLVASQKGGVGKTTSAINLATATALTGNRVLLIDTDPLNSVSAALNLSRDASVSFRTLGVPTDAPIWRNVMPNLDITSPYDVGDLVDSISIHDFMSKIQTSPVADQYAWAVIDSPPVITGSQLRDLLVNSDELMIVIRAEPMAFRTLPTFLQLVKNVQQTGGQVKVRGILVTLPPGEPLGGSWESELRRCFGHSILPQAIPYDSEVGRALLLGRPVLTVNPKAAAAEQYIALAQCLGLISAETETIDLFNDVPAEFAHLDPGGVSGTIELFQNEDEFAPRSTPLGLAEGVAPQSIPAEDQPTEYLMPPPRFGMEAPEQRPTREPLAPSQVHEMISGSLPELTEALHGLNNSDNADGDAEEPATQSPVADEPIEVTPPVVPVDAIASTLASGSWDKSVQLWDTPAGTPRTTLRGHTGDVTSVAYTPDGLTLATASWDKTVKLWDIRTGEEKLTLKGHGGVVSSVTFTPQGETLSTASWDKTIRLWETATGRLINTLRGHTGVVTAVNFAPQGELLASAGWDKTIRLWQYRSGTEQLVLTGHQRMVTSVAISPMGDWIASGSWDKTVRLWKRDNGQCLSTFKGHSGDVTSVAFSPDQPLLASGSLDHTVKLWDLSGNREKAVLRSHTAEVTAVAFSPDGKLLATASWDRTVKLWDAQSGALNATLQGHTGVVTSVAFAPNGQTLVSSSLDRTVKVWNLDGEEVHSFMVQTGSDQSKAEAAPVAPQQVSDATAFAPQQRKAGTVTPESNWLAPKTPVTEVNIDPPNQTSDSPSGSATSPVTPLEHRSLPPARNKGIAPPTEPFFPLPADLPRSKRPSHAIPPVDLRRDQSAPPVPNQPTPLALPPLERDTPDNPSGMLQPFSLPFEPIRLSPPVPAAETPRAIEPSQQPLIPGMNPNKPTPQVQPPMITESSIDDSFVDLWAVQEQPPSQHDFGIAPTAPQAGPRSSYRNVPAPAPVTNSPANPPRAELPSVPTTMAPSALVKKMTQVAKSPPPATPARSAGGLNGLVFSPDGQRIASARMDATILVWDVTNGTVCYRLKGHQGDVHALAFSPDNLMLVSAGQDQTIRFWETNSGTEWLSLAGHLAPITALSFSPDGRYLASGSWDQSIKLWDLVNGEEGAVLTGHTDGVSSLSFSSDGLSLASGSEDGTIRLWDVGSGKCTLVMGGNHREVRSVAYAQDGQTVASASGDGMLRVWDTLTGEEWIAIQAHQRASSTVSYSSEGSNLASGGWDMMVRVWHAITGQERFALNGHKSEVTGVAFSPDGQILASTSFDETLRLWDPYLGDELAILRDQHAPVISPPKSRRSSIVTSKSGTRAMPSSQPVTPPITRRSPSAPPTPVSHYDEDDALAPITDDPDYPAESFTSPPTDFLRVALDSAIQAEEKSKSQMSGAPPVPARFVAPTPPPAIAPIAPPRVPIVATQPMRPVPAPESRTNLSAPPAPPAPKGPGSGIYRMNGNGSRSGSGTTLPTGSRSITNSSGTRSNADLIPLSPDMILLAGVGGEGIVVVWDLMSGKEFRHLKGHTDDVNATTFTPDGRFLLTGGFDKVVRLWDVAAGSLVHRFEGHKGEISSISVSPNGRTVATASFDQTVRLWDLATGQDRGVLLGHKGAVSCVAFSPDGRTIASGSWDRTFRLWDVDSRREIGQYKAHEKMVTALAFAPNGRTLATGGWDKCIKLWDLAEGHLLLEAIGHSFAVSTMAFVPDGQLLITGSWDTSVKVWDLAAGVERRALRGHTEAVRSLSVATDGRTLATASWDGTLRLWDIGTEGEQGILKMPIPKVQAVAFAPLPASAFANSNSRQTAGARG